LAPIGMRYQAPLIPAMGRSYRVESDKNSLGSTQPSNCCQFV
jgi:hypothetical protein